MGLLDDFIRPLITPSFSFSLLRVARLFETEDPTTLAAMATDETTEPRERSNSPMLLIRDPDNQPRGQVL